MEKNKKSKNSNCTNYKCDKFIAIDPGMYKCGIAVMGYDTTVYYKGKIYTENIIEEVFSILKEWETNRIVLGNSTSAKDIIKKIQSIEHSGQWSVISGHKSIRRCSERLRTRSCKATKTQSSSIVDGLSSMDSKPSTINYQLSTINQPSVATNNQQLTTNNIPKSTEDRANIEIITIEEKFSTLYARKKYIEDNKSKKWYFLLLPKNILNFFVPISELDAYAAVIIGENFLRIHDKSF